MTITKNVFWWAATNVVAGWFIANLSLSLSFSLSLSLILPAAPHAHTYQRGWESGLSISIPIFVSILSTGDRESLKVRPNNIFAEIVSHQKKREHQVSILWQQFQISVAPNHHGQVQSFEPQHIKSFGQNILSLTRPKIKEFKIMAKHLALDLKSFGHCCCKNNL